MKKMVLLLVFLFMSTVFAETKKVTVLLDWFANPNHAPLFVAKAQGFFAEQNLEVELLGPANSADPPKLVARGKADIAITYQPQFMEQIDHGLPLIRIGTLIDKPLTCLAVLKNSSIKSIADLKGKRIGYSSGGVNCEILSVMLKNHHLSLTDVERINVNYDLSQALLTKKIDAVTDIMRNFEIIQMELVGAPVRIFLPEKNGVPPYSELILVANKNKIHDPKLSKFLIALKKGVFYLKKHPQESWITFAKTHPELNDKLNQRAWFSTLPYFSDNPYDFDVKSWHHFANFMQQNSLISRVYPIETYAINLQK